MFAAFSMALRLSSASLRFDFCWYFMNDGIAIAARMPTTISPPRTPSRIQSHSREALRGGGG